ncbi:MAG: CBS domain-containing protein [bacterium]
MTKVPTVDDYMATTLYTFLPSDNVRAAAQTLMTKRLSGAPVVDESDKLIGMLSKKDCLKVVYTASYHQDWGGRVDEYMSRDVETIESGTDIIQAADKFVQSRYRRFPVMAGSRMIGQISRQDILRALYDQWVED